MTHNNLGPTQVELMRQAVQIRFWISFAFKTLIAFAIVKYLIWGC